MEAGTVIFYSWLSLWSMKSKSGAPSFYKTIELYVKKGWNVYLITVDKKNLETDLLCKENIFVMPEKSFDFILSNTKFRKVSLFIRQLHFYLFAKNITKKVVKTIENDKLIAYAYEVYGVKSAKWTAKKFGIPYITRFQGTILDGVRDNAWNRLRYYPHFYALRQKADLIIMTNDGTRGNVVLKRLHNESKQIKFWMNGLDILEDNAIKEFKDIRKELGISSEKRVLLTVSRLENWKRVERAIYALKEVLKYNADVVLIIVGDGSARDSLERITKEERIQDKVYFIGAIPHEEVYHFMKSCDIFLSLYDLSNIGNPLLEAMSLGCCIVTLNVGDTKQIVDNEKNGVIVDMDRIAELPIIITDLLGDHEKRKHISLNAEKYARSNFYTWETRMNMEYEEILGIMQNH